MTELIKENNVTKNSIELKFAEIIKACENKKNALLTDLKNQFIDKKCKLINQLNQWKHLQNDLPVTLSLCFRIYFLFF